MGHGAKNRKIFDFRHIHSLVYTILNVKNIKLFVEYNTDLKKFRIIRCRGDFLSFKSLFSTVISIVELHNKYIKHN